MAKRLNKTLLDYLVIAISPAMIMVLVDSLVLFLIQVFYRGNWDGRLGCVLTLFVIGAVLIARISINEGRERAVLFAIPLGIAILLAISRFVQFQGPLASFSFPINCGLIFLIWWSADKLTWDCTVIDEREEDSGEGLLETVGLDRPDHAAVQREIVPVAESEATASHAEPAASWWDRFVERRRRPHAPGVWVVYFSLAALPLFGLGQLFISVGDVSARQSAFGLLVVYTASGLGLLLSTSFLGLRRYLRQRRQEMPFLMINLWLGIGLALIVGVMLVAMLLPRTNAEYAISELPISIGSPDQKASPYGVGPEGAEEDRPDARLESRDDAKEDAPQSNESGKNNMAESKDAQKKKSGKNSSEQAKQPGEKQAAKEQDKSKGEQQKDGKADKGKPSKPAGSSTPQPPVLPKMPFPHGFPAFAVLLKWVFYLVLAVLVLFAVWKHRADLLAGLRDLWQSLADLWNRLFGGVRRTDAAAKEEKKSKGPSLRRFADFANPFAAGTAERYRPEQLVRYTFEALEAWARDNGHPRLPEQTPHEFARGLAIDFPSLAGDVGQLAELYCHVAYASATLPAASVSRLPHLWQEMWAARFVAVSRD